MTVEKAALSMAITEDIKPLLAGMDADIQGSVLSELLALHLAAWPAQERYEVLRRIILTSIQLADVNEKLLHGESGHPGNRLN